MLELTLDYCYGLGCDEWGNKDAEGVVFLLWPFLVCL